jgi:hypothetical protein
MVMKWIKYVAKMNSCSGLHQSIRSTTRCEWFDGDDGVDAANGDGDDAQASLDLSSGEDLCPSTSFPFKSLPEVGFLRLSGVYGCWISLLFFTG